jgi:lytic murein transglycosylase
MGFCSWPRGGLRQVRIAAFSAFLGALSLTGPAVRAEENFQRFLESLWPQAQAYGVTRKTFDTALRGLEPDLALPDLVLPGRDKPVEKGQAEFTRAPQEYLDKAYLVRLAGEGKTLLARHAAALAAIERELGVDRYSVLAIWGRETAFGNHKLPHDAIRVLATQAWLGRRKEMFQTELLYALKMLEAGVPRADMRASWAGAMGLTQFMPSEYFVHTHDLDGDGRVDIFRSVADALASAARQLKGKGWVPGQTWGYEVRVPATADCSLEGPTQARPLSDWAKLGFARAGQRAWSPKELAQEAYLMMPAGAYGPAFLVLENYKVIRRYNTSDLYAVFVGHLADRIAGGGDFEAGWGGTGPQRTRVIEEIQQRLQAKGYDVEKIDGKVGSNTRKVIGSYQKANGLKVDCWPSDAVLAHLGRAASAR